MDTPTPVADGGSSKNVWWIVAVIVVIVAVALIWWWQSPGGSTTGSGADTSAAVNEQLQAIDLGNLDQEFQAIDQSLNSL